MAELIAKEALPEMAPVTGAGVELTALALQPIWSVALFAGQAKAAEKALKPLGLAFPAPNTWAQGKDGARLVWTGRDQAFLLGAAPPAGLSDAAALTDQSDGWAGFRLAGPGAADVLARLVAVDLREAAFPPGAALRSALNHMSAVFLRDDAGIVLFVFRSMARTALHELTEVVHQLKARGPQAV